MTDLSPAAQTIWHAFRDATNCAENKLAAALRAAADQVVPFSGTKKVTFTEKQCKTCVKTSSPSLTNLKPMVDCQEYRFQVPPEPKGWWVIGKSHWGQTQFAVHVKPNRLHQLMTKLFFGWDWIDND